MFPEKNSASLQNSSEELAPHLVPLGKDRIGVLVELLNLKMIREVAEKAELNVSDDDPELDLRNRLSSALQSPEFGVSLSSRDMKILLSAYNREGQQRKIPPEQMEALKVTIEGLELGFPNLLRRQDSGIVKINPQKSLMQKVIGAFKRK